MVGSLDRISKHFSLELLADGVYAAIHTEGGAAICNAGLIDLGGLLVVFDTFLTPQAARDLRCFSETTFGRAPQFVINSHYHNDHVWGNQVFAEEAQIISSARTRQLFDTEGKAELSWCNVNAAQQLELMRERYQGAQDDKERQGLLGMLGYYEGIVESLPNLTVHKPGITFERSLMLHGEKRSAELITFEDAHTDSDTVLFLPSDQIIFMSDLLFVQSHPYLSEGNPDALLAVLRQISRLDATCYVPGHGGLGSGEDIAQLIEYVEDCQDVVKGVINTGGDLKALEGIDIPEKYQLWQLPQMFQGNLKSIYERKKDSG